MEYLGAVENLSYKPISDYNSFLKGNASFNVDTNDFDTVLNQKMGNIHDVQKNNPIDNFDIAQNSVRKTDGSSPVGNLMNRIENAFGSGLNDVNDKKQAADRAQEALVMGEDVSVHDVMIAAEKSALSMNLALQLRNKLVQAYTEINNVKV